ncbi:MAG TPA: ABC transporter transmembrane domain-containing protein [Burkholderiales bacterium]|nr:ABC transporter transmembrane domain-containing protein [Burkholderiales bacterium]HEX2650151.1 ABC transporter transmembrane domain-containing protein [Burkholderiales bacterium]
MPKSLFGYIWRTTARHQVVLCALSAAVFLLSTVPLELQRRIVNDAIKRGALDAILWLAIAYAGVSLCEGGIKLFLNIYRSWVSERAVLDLRGNIGRLTGAAAESSDSSSAGGVEVSMMLSEVEPIGSFIGMSISEPLLQGGILVSVFGYLAFLEPWLALLAIGIFSPQLVFVPLMQGAINRRVERRIQTLRKVSGGIVEAATNGEPVSEGEQRARVERVFRLNMGVFKLKFSMNFLMNLLHHLGVAMALGVGGWHVVQGSLELGTVVAFVSGLGKVNDPWRDVVNWFREMMVVRVRYGLISSGMRRIAEGDATAQASPA